MTFQPIIPFGGYAGWKLLTRTQETQQEAFNNSIGVKRATDAFRERLGEVSSAEDLVNDRQLLEVALGAFGLDDDINNKFFIQKVLEESTLEADTLPNRLSDKRYLSLSQMFGFGDLGGAGNTVRSTFADEIIERFEARQFERAVGNQNDNMRLALNFSGELQDVIDQTESEDAQWFSIMGSPPLRTVVEAALGLPSGLARIDLDQQLTAFKDRAERTFGSSSPADFLSEENNEKLVRLFLVRNDSQSSASLSGASIAITLLQGTQTQFF